MISLGQLIFIWPFGASVLVILSFLYFRLFMLTFWSWSRFDRRLFDDSLVTLHSGFKLFVCHSLTIGSKTIHRLKIVLGCIVSTWWTMISSWRALHKWPLRWSQSLPIAYMKLHWIRYFYLFKIIFLVAIAAFSFLNWAIRGALPVCCPRIIERVVLEGVKLPDYFLRRHIDGLLY